MSINICHNTVSGELYYVTKRAGYVKEKKVDQRLLA